MRKVRPFLVAGLVFALIAACSDGGSDAPVNRAEITSANAPTVAGAVLKATVEGGELGSFATLSGGAGGSASGKPANVYSKVGESQIAHTKPMLTESQTGTFYAPITPIEEPCAVSGNIVTTGDVQDPSTLSAGDVITLQFNDCDDGLSVVDGTMSMTVRAFAGDFVGDSVSFEVTVDLTSFSVTQDGETQTANGGLTLDMDLPSAGPLTMTISSENLSTTDGTSTETLQEFSLTQTIDPVTLEYTLTASGRLTSSAFGGVVDFSTSIGLEGTDEANAGVGRIVITGDANATITIIVLDADLIRLNVDLDGDGGIDEVIDTSWDELT